MKLHWLHTRSLSGLALLFALPSSALAQTPDELAKQTQNPIASLISVPLQGNWDFGVGHQKASRTILNFQPVMPFSVTPSTNMIVRVIVPMMSQPGFGGTRTGGIGDSLATGFFSPKKTGRYIWGAGPAVLLPTATDPALGYEKFGLGPSVVVLTQPGQWTLGALANQIWSVDGSHIRNAVNQTYLQPFGFYNLGNGLSMGVSMEATGNYEAAQTWTNFMLFNISKVALLGKRPVSFSVAGGPTLANGDGGPSWRFRLAANFLYPR